MSVSFYDFTTPLFMRGLTVLSDYMDKTIAYSETHPADLFEAKLAPDMFPLSRQVQSACDKAKNGIARLISVPAPSFQDTETTFKELKTRIAKTLTFLNMSTPAQFEGADERMVEFRFPGVKGPISGHAYLTEFLLPDFCFHVATVHDILRHNGLAIGKADYLGKRGA
jgi:hypothetical protein